MRLNSITFSTKYRKKVLFEKHCWHISDRFLAEIGTNKKREQIISGPENVKMKTKLQNR